MATVLKTDHSHIVRIEGVCGGEPIIDGLRVTVRHAATLRLRGETPPEIADALNISESLVIHALCYYIDHQEEIDALIEQEESQYPR